MSRDISHCVADAASIGVFGCIQGAVSLGVSDIAMVHRRSAPAAFSAAGALHAHE